MLHNSCIKQPAKVSIIESIPVYDEKEETAAVTYDAAEAEHLPAEMEGREWEDLPEDCLAEVLGRVGMESLLLHIPFVCKSWYKASLNPLCWERLVFPKELYLFEAKYQDRIRPGLYWLKKVFMAAVDRYRSHGRCTELDLKYLLLMDSDLTDYAVDKLPYLRRLYMPFSPYHYRTFYPELIRKLTQLEDLRLGSGFDGFRDITAQIKLNCKNFISLSVCYDNSPYFSKEDASSIVTNLPNIKHLNICCAFVKQECLVMILRGCKDLVHLEMNNCRGFELNEEIVTLTSHMTTFRCEISMIEIHWDVFDSISDMVDGISEY